MKAEKSTFLIILSLSRLFGPRINSLALKAVCKGWVSIPSPGTGAGHGCFYTSVLQRPPPQATITMPALTSLFTPLSMENYVRKVAGVAYRPLWTCFWQNSRKPAGSCWRLPALLCPYSLDNPEKPEGCSGMGLVHSELRNKGHLSFFSWAQTMHLPSEAKALNFYVLGFKKNQSNY